MRNILVIILFIFFFNHSYGQDNFNYLFPFNLNVTKFESLKILNQNTNLHLNNDGNDGCEWEFEAYLNDSVYNCHIFFQFPANKFFHGYESMGYLGYADDKLFITLYKIKYKPTELNKLLEDYNALKNVIEEKYKYSITNKIENTEHRQTGEGLSYSNLNKDERWNSKYEKYPHVDLTYTAFERDASVFHSESAKNYVIDFYTLEISYIDFSQVKFDRRGFMTKSQGAW